MTVLPDHYIYELTMNADHPMILPFSTDQLQPASYDVKLGNEFIIHEPHDEYVIDLDKPNITTKKVKAGRNGFVLHPGEMALGHTQEIVRIPNNIMARIEGKSSIGRLGLAIHITAGFIDPGFNGKVTLEMVNLVRVPIVLRPGKLVAQLSFQYLESACQNPYNGRYQGDMGVTESRYGRDRKDDVTAEHPTTILPGHES